MASWFTDHRDIDKIGNGLRETALTSTEVGGIMGDNWYRFYADNFGPA